MCPFLTQLAYCRIRHRDQWNRKSAEISPDLHGQPVTKEARITQWRKDSSFNKWCWDNWTATSKRMKLDHCFTPHTKITWIKELNIRADLS